jgi:hypothetical protein
LSFLTKNPFFPLCEKHFHVTYSSLFYFCPPSEHRQSAVWASAKRRLPCRLSADGASSVRRLTAGKAPFADRFVRRLPTLGPPTADNESADKWKVKGNRVKSEK